MNSFTAPANNMSGIEKWSLIYQTMKVNKTVILALQETHLNNTLVHSINECFRKRLTVINYKLPTNPQALAGVVFVIDRTLISVKELEVKELIEGCALAIKFKWHENEELLIMSVYAPNNRSEHPNFWEQIDAKRQSKGLRHPNILLGDFNQTEEPIDRSPAHLDDANAIVALRNLQQCLGLEDTWCHAFPHERCFTFHANTNRLLN